MTSSIGDTMKHWTIGSVALAALAASVVAQAAPPGKSAGQHAEHGKAGEHGKAEAARAQTDHKDTPPAVKAERGEAGAEEREPHPGLGKGHGHHSSAMEALQEDLKHGKLKKEELTERLAALEASRQERQKEHRAELGERWGKSLESPPVREELRHHARRSALLNRALLVAETDPQVKDKDKLVARVEKLIEKENARHEKAMQRFEASTDPSTKPATNPSLNVPAKGTEP